MQYRKKIVIVVMMTPFLLPFCKISMLSVLSLDNIKSLGISLKSEMYDKAEFL